MSLSPPEKVQKLQKALHAKAKESPSYRFYALYDKIWREDILAFAYRCSKANRGEVGVDGQDFDQIEQYGLQRWLGELAQELRTKTYRPQALRRAWTPKPDGSKRPLGIPTVRDRVVQTAALAVLGPIFEADMSRRAGRAVCVPPEPRRTGRGDAGSRTREHGSSRCSGCRLERLLRQSRRAGTRRTHEIGGSSCQ